MLYDNSHDVSLLERFTCKVYLLAYFVSLDFLDGAEPGERVFPLKGNAINGNTSVGGDILNLKVRSWVSDFFFSDT